LYGAWHVVFNYITVASNFEDLLEQHVQHENNGVDLVNRTEAKKNFLRKGEGTARFGMKRLHLKKRSSQLPQKASISTTKFTNSPDTQNETLSPILSGGENLSINHHKPSLFVKV